jgi:hypothetical protein
MKAPSYMPAGYKFMGGANIMHGAAALAYSDSKHELFVIENSIAGFSGGENDTTVYYKSCTDKHVMAFGDAGKEELQKVADSIC